MRRRSRWGLPCLNFFSAARCSLRYEAEAVAASRMVQSCGAYFFFIARCAFRSRGSSSPRFMTNASTPTPPFFSLSRRWRSPIACFNSFISRVEIDVTRRERSLKSSASDPRLEFPMQNSIPFLRFRAVDST